MEGAIGDRYVPLETLRASIFGEILRCVDTQSQQEIVVKTVDLALAAKRQSRARAHVQEDARAEVEALTRLRALGGHPNVLALRECFVSADSRVLFVVLEYCDGGDLLDACVQQDSGATTGAAQSRRIDEYQALGYMRDVLAGLRFLHANGIAHRDLSLENILLRNGRAVIADFGLCALRDERPDAGADADEFLCSEIVGKHYYMAPEVVSQKGAYDPRLADIWSLGVAFFILVTSSPPFEIASMEDAGFRFVAKHGVKAVLKVWGLTDELSDASQDLLERMLQVDAMRRISLPELLRHPAIANFPTSPVSVSAPL